MEIHRSYLPSVPNRRELANFLYGPIWWCPKELNYLDWKHSLNVNISERKRSITLPFSVQLMSYLRVIRWANKKNWQTLFLMDNQIYSKTYYKASIVGGGGGENPPLSFYNRRVYYQLNCSNRSWIVQQWGHRFTFTGLDTLRVLNYYFSTTP